MNISNLMIRSEPLTIVGVLVVGVLLASGQVARGQTAPAATLTAMVQDQACQGGDAVAVTLTATLSPPKRNVQYQWDFNNDGIFDTAPSPDPTVTHNYPDETNQTATVKVTKGTRSATDSVTFSTLRCEG
jgi:uncharacterized protein (DUF58 family)